MDFFTGGAVGFVLGGLFWVPVTAWLKTRWARARDKDPKTW